MATTKITKREKLAKVLEYIPTEEKELRELIEKEIETLVKKSNTKSKAEREKAAANEILKATIIEVLKKAEKPMTITEMMEDESLVGVSNQKISSMIRQIGTDTIVRTEEKRKAYFSLR